MKDYKLVRSNRKTVGIRITEDATVEIRAPHNLPKKDIDAIVQSKQAWIDAHLEARAVQYQQKKAFALQYGYMLCYRGQDYPIVSRAGNRVGFDNTAFYMPEGLNSEEIKHAAIQIYKMLAKRDLTAKVIDFAKQMQVRPIAVKINSATTRWGSCSGRNSLNFSWRLILAEDAVIDYVVVHELAHIEEHNHSPQFWAVVAGVFPDYQVRKEGLRSLQARMATENWE